MELAFAVANREVLAFDIGHLDTASKSHNDRRGCFVFASVSWGEPARGLSLNQLGAVSGDAVGDLQ